MVTSRLFLIGNNIVTADKEGRAWLLFRGVGGEEALSPRQPVRGIRCQLFVC